VAPHPHVQTSLAEDAIQPANAIARSYSVAREDTPLPEIQLLGPSYIGTMLADALVTSH
jgi:hypothetical protein